MAKNKVKDYVNNVRNDSDYYSEELEDEYYDYLDNIFSKKSRIRKQEKIKKDKKNEYKEGYNPRR